MFVLSTFPQNYCSKIIQMCILCMHMVIWSRISRASPTVSGVAKGGPSRARPYQSSVVPYQKLIDSLQTVYSKYVYLQILKSSACMKEP